jgi:predicted permease
MHYFLIPIVIFGAIAGNIKPVSFKWEVYLSVIFSIVLVFCVGQVYIYFMKIEKKNNFLFSMSCYRSNVSLGLALIYFLCDPGVFIDFCIFLFIIIPLTDAMTIISATWLGENNKTKEDIVRLLIKSISYNPIIIAGVLGILLSKNNILLPVFITNFINLIYPAVFPLALILTGAMLCPVKIRSLSNLAVAGSILKTIILPSFGYLFISLFSVSGEIFGVIIIFLSLPYMLDHQIHLTTPNIQREVMMPFYSISALFSFMVISIVLHFLF